jgi:hypothetical protein
MGWPRTLLFLSAAYVFAFILAYWVPSFIHRQEFDQAFSAWYRNPTPENASALGIQQLKNGLIHLEDSAIVALVPLIVFCEIYEGLRIGKHYYLGKKRPWTSR